MDSKEIEKLITKHTPKVKRYTEQRAYFSGRHPAIFAEYAKEAPDNRVPVPILRKAVKTVMGYMFRQGDIVYSGNYYESTLKPIFDLNEEQILTSEIAETSLVNGVAYELHYFDGVQHRFAQVDPRNAIPIFSDDLVPVMTGFIRHYKIDDIEHADIYDSATIAEYVKIDGEYRLIVERPHGFKSVPVVEYTMSGDKSNLFDHVRDLMDLLDRSLSEDVANELQRYANAYLLLAENIDSTNKDENGETELDKIKRTRVFEGLRENVLQKVAFLTKQIDPTFINTALDRVERLVYEMLSVPNPADQVFAAQTGIALEYKLQPFEYLCSSIQSYFVRGLQQRIRLVGNLDAAINGGGHVSEVSISFHRNKPDDVSTIADNAIKLGLSKLSIETILKMFPSSIIPDVEAEMRRLETEVQAFDEVTEPEEGADDREVQEAT